MHIYWTKHNPNFTVRQCYNLCIIVSEPRKIISLISKYWFLIENIQDNKNMVETNTKDKINFNNIFIFSLRFNFMSSQTLMIAHSNISI